MAAFTEEDGEGGPYEPPAPPQAGYDNQPFEPGPYFGGDPRGGNPADGQGGGYTYPPEGGPYGGGEAGYGQGGPYGGGGQGGPYEGAYEGGPYEGGPYPPEETGPYSPNEAQYEMGPYGGQGGPYEGGPYEEYEAGPYGGPNPPQPPPPPPSNVNVTYDMVCSPANPVRLRVAWQSQTNSAGGWWLNISTDPNFNYEVKHIYLSDPSTRSYTFPVAEVGSWEDWRPGMGQLTGGYQYYVDIYNISLDKHSSPRPFFYRSCAVRLDQPTYTCNDYGRPTINLNWNIGDLFGYQYFRVWDDFSNVDGTGFSSGAIWNDYVSYNYSYQDTTKYSGQPANYWIFAKGIGYETWSNSGPNGVDGAGYYMTPYCTQPPPEQACPSSCHPNGFYVQDGVTVTPRKFCPGNYAANYNQACSSAPNACNERSQGTYNCYGTCQAVTPPACTPPTITSVTSSSCSAAGLVQWSGPSSNYGWGWGYSVDIFDSSGNKYSKWVWANPGDNVGSTTLPKDDDPQGYVGLSANPGAGNWSVRVWNGSVSSPSPFTTSSCPPALTLSMSYGFNTYFANNTLQFAEGDSAGLSWNSTNARSCTSSGNWSVSGTSGNSNTGFLTAAGSPYTYSMFCSRGAVNTPPKTFTVNVYKAAFIKTTGGNVHSNENIVTPGQ